MATRIASHAKRIRQAQEDARRDAFQMAIKITEGKEYSPEQVSAVCRDAEIPGVQFATWLETLAERKALADAYKPVDTKAVVGKLVAESRKMTEERDTLIKEKQARIQELNRAIERNSSRRSGIVLEAEESAKAFRQAMARTGDTDDWRILD